MRCENLQAFGSDLVPFREVGEVPVRDTCRGIDREINQSFGNDERMVMGQTLGIVDDVESPHAEDRLR